MAYKDDLFKMLLINFFVWIWICMQSVLISLILGYVDSDSNDISMLHGFVLISAYIGLDLLQNIMTEQISLIQNWLEIKIKNGVTSLIFDKVLRISSSSSKEFAHGEIINLISICCSIIISSISLISPKYGDMKIKKFWNFFEYSHPFNISEMFQYFPKNI